jgi:hypothetical protein
MIGAMTSLKLSATLAVLSGAAVAPALAQGPVGGAPMFGAPAPGAPNLTGKWINATPMIALKTVQGKDPPLNAKGRAEFAKHKANLKADPNNLCQMQGEPRLLYTAYAFLILQYQTHVDFVHEVNHTFRIVRFGATLDPDSDPIWLGHSSARMDSKALVIDSVNYNDKTWLDYQGLPHSDQLKTQERYTLSADGDTVNGTVVIDDPQDYSRPWTTAFTLKKMPGSTLRQFACADDHKM